ncbi:hypothetical protein BH09PAT2_BH09PAT2_07390 [soil metagenome]
MNARNETMRSIFFIIAVVLVSTIIVYLPFLTHSLHLLGYNVEEKGMSYIYQNFDGVLYIVPAKTWYVPKAIANLRLELPLPQEYYAAHLPVYPLFIALMAPITGYLQAMIGVNILFTMVAVVVLFLLLKQFKLTKNPLILSVLFLFLPRLLVLRTVGAPEMLFLAAILGSVYFFEKNQLLLASILGAIAAATKTPGVLLFVAYGMVFVEQMIIKKTFSWRWFSILLIPLGLLATFYFYQQQMGDFWAYFHTGGVVPMPYPFSVFNSEARWVGTIWLEEIILYFFIYGFAVISLKDTQHRSIFYFPLVFLIASAFVQHRDLSRYMVPLWPFALIAFERTMTSKKFLIIALLLLPAIYLYAWNFLLSNTLPISDWSAFL